MTTAKDEGREKCHKNLQNKLVFLCKGLSKKAANVHTKQPLANSLSLNIL